MQQAFQQNIILAALPTTAHAADDMEKCFGVAMKGKNDCAAGAFVAGSDDLIESLIQFARPYIYTTSQPPARRSAPCASHRSCRRWPAAGIARQRPATAGRSRR